MDWLLGIRVRFVFDGGFFGLSHAARVARNHIRLVVVGEFAEGRRDVDVDGA